MKRRVVQMETLPRRIFSLAAEVFETSRARILVYIGISSFITFALMGLICLLTYMRVSRDYEEKVIRERSGLLADIQDQVAKASFLEGKIKVYRDAISALSKSGKRKPLGSFAVTAYDPVESCKPFDDGMTAKLIPAGLGIAAVDPRIIPYGSVLYLPELDRYFLACDTGAAMKRNGGKNIDLLMPTVEAARKFGRQHLEIELIDLSAD